MPRQRTNYCPKCGHLNLARATVCEECGAVTSRAWKRFKALVVYWIVALPLLALVVWWAFDKMKAIGP